MEEYLNKFPQFFSNRNLEDITSINDFISPPKNWVNNPFLFKSMDKVCQMIYHKHKEIE